ncbi:MAG: DNA polymerase III subunit gamma/tau [Pyrinomonadaceae bacterium]
MSYQVIARKWRPQVFEEVIGQEPITRTLRNAIEHERLHHAYIFSGARGVGKTTTARLLAKALNCRKSDSANPTPCDVSIEGACESCVEVAEGRSLDVLEFDAASHTKVEEIREIILEGINVNPARDRNKIFIIDEVHMLSRSSFNALLKTLEEPPPNVVFIMATTELHKVPDTILSRCQEFEFRTIPLAKIQGRLRTIADAEGIEIEDKVLIEIARSGEGSMRDAQSNFDQVISFAEGAVTADDVASALGIAGAEVVVSTLTAIAEKDSARLVEIVSELSRSGHDLTNFCGHLMVGIRDILVFKLAGSSETLFETSAFDEEDIRKISEQFGERDLIRFFNSLSETSARLRDANEPRYLLEVGLLKLAEMSQLAPLESILNRLAELEERIGNGSENQTMAAAQTGEVKKKTLATESKTPDEVETDRPEDTRETPVEVDLGGAQSADSSNISTVTDPFGDSLPESENFYYSDPKIEFESAPDQFEEELIPSAPSFDASIQLSSEDLEHFEDRQMDADFESFLERKGDNLRPVKLPETELLKFRVKKANEAYEFPPISVEEAAKDNRAVKIAADFQNEPAEEAVEVYELPENPTEEDLLKRAQSDTRVRTLVRMFKGEIVDVRKSK